ncbi:uncharacterized protein TNCV_5113131 [Trichonephila clavipes]|nr:uncharacterized protein TNCV_5113131 [Trichonephila clavipes]
MSTRRSRVDLREHHSISHQVIKVVVFQLPTPTGLALVHAQCLRSVYVANRRSDNSSDETFLNGNSGVFMTTPSDENYQRVFSAGSIATCFTYELRAMIEALDQYETLPILEQARGLVIFCDSKAALQAILKGGSRINDLLLPI